MSDKKHFISLKAKIMIATLIPIIASFALIGTVVLISLLTSLRQAAQSEFLQISQKYSHSFETKINDAMNYLSVLSSELEAQVETGTVDREVLQKSIFKVFNDYKLIDGSSIYFETNMYDGKDNYYIGSEYGTEKSGKICWYYYIDNGVTAYLPEGIEDEIEFTLPHYTEAKEKNKPIYTNPVSYEIDGKHIPMFTLTYPINNSAGEFIGAVTVDLFLNDIYAQLQEQKIYETGYVIIANDNEQVIYSPHYGDVGKTRKEAGLNYPLPSEEKTSDFFNAKSIINGKDTFITVECIHIPQLDSNFYVSVAAPLDEVNAKVIRLMMFLIILIVLVVTAIAILIYYLIRKISAPLNEITESANRIAGGEYSARITGAYKGEFAVVKDSVNTMADSIEAYIEESENSLNVLKNILNGLDAYVYVSDPSTDEILFINDNIKRRFNISDDKTGQVCWKVLQSGLEGRCKLCPCFQLDKEPDEIIIWEEHNTVTSRYYRNTDRYIEWIGGGKVHLQHSVDITDIKHAQFALDRRLEQQALMASISQSFLSHTDIAMLVTEALRQTGRFLGVAQILYYKLKDDGSTFVCQCEWINPKTSKQTGIGIEQKVPDSLIAYMKTLSEKNIFCLNSKDPAIKATMDSYTVNFENYISVPIFVKGELYGALDFFREEVDEEWSNSDINLAVLVSSLLSGVFDRTSMEGQLRRLSSIVESSPQFIMYLTADGTVDYVNPAAVSITGYSEAELIEGGLGIMYDDAAVQDIKEKYIPGTLKDGTKNFEINLICKDGRKRIMAFSSFTTGKDSSNVGSIANDVTEMRKLEAELIASKELAEQGSRSKSEFLSRMSHEMRTPMNAVIGMTNIARESNDPEKKEYCLERIDNASRHLLGVINDILDMSKIEANKFELSYSEFSFERMTQHVLDVINFRIEEKHQNLLLYVDPSIPSLLMGDEQRLAQVITNLLSNAVKFTPEGGTIQLKVKVIVEEANVLTMQVEVLDSGIGISPEHQSRLFRSFEQADGSIARKFGGTGLGLAISKRIVELMDGNIWVESEVEKGSIFKFTFTALRVQDSAAESLKNDVDICKLNIMAVDGSPEVCEYFSDIMAKIGVPCTVISEGVGALEIFKNSPNPFNIVFVDWQIPEMNGIELARELRKYSSSSTIIIIISVAEWSKIEKEAIQAGVNGFIPKPLLPSLITDCISKYMGGSEDEIEESEEPVVKTFEGKMALLAEDVEINREIVMTVLENTMLGIDCAEDGSQAVEMFKANPGKYNIIFMDMHMPEVDGLEATRRIRALDIPEAKRVPIVAMTANVFKEDVEKCLSVGMNDHIGKPIDFDELFEKLRIYLG